MMSAHWLSRWCEDCPTADAVPGPGQRRCPHHCRCPREEKNNLPFEVSEPVRQVIERARHPSAARTSALPMDEPALEETVPALSGTDDGDDDASRY
jgi:hypothetical protein